MDTLAGPATVATAAAMPLHRRGLERNSIPLPNSEGPGAGCIEAAMSSLLRSVLISPTLAIFEPSLSGPRSATCGRAQGSGPRPASRRRTPGPRRRAGCRAPCPGTRFVKGGAKNIAGTAFGTPTHDLKDCINFEEHSFKNSKCLTHCPPPSINIL